MSTRRNQTATTAAPIKPATIPSFRIDRCTDSIVSERAAGFYCSECRELGSDRGWPEKEATRCRECRELGSDRRMA
jgi:predicted RNA-binding Zn-ribbon protein involved in translation (DUF1610 family)